MKCPEPIAAILLAIIQAGNLRVRAAAWSGAAERCAIEADHIHNLPGLLHDYSEERLKFYWEVERLSFIDRSDETPLKDFEDHWEQLRDEVGFLDGRVSAATRN